MKRPTVSPVVMLVCGCLATPVAGSGAIMLLMAAYSFLFGVMSDGNSDLGIALGMLGVCVQVVAGCLLVILGLGVVAAVVADGWLRTIAGEDVEDY